MLKREGTNRKFTEKYPFDRVSFRILFHIVLSGICLRRNILVTNGKQAQLLTKYVRSSLMGC